MKTLARNCAGALALVGALPAAASARQSEIYAIEGRTTRSYFGNSLAVVGDLDRDGRPDFAVGAPEDWTNGAYAGWASVHSGRDGSRLLDWSGVAGDSLGFDVAPAGDVTGDAIPDVLVGAPGAVEPVSGLATGAMHVYSGADGSLVRTLFGVFDGESFGTAIADLGDVDGDGVDDVVIGAPGASYTRPGSGTAYLISGASGTAIGRFDGAAARDGLGGAVAATGDLDLDGIRDFAVAAPTSSPGGRPFAGELFACSGATLQPLFTVAGEWHYSELGSKLAAGVDIDRDRVPDLVVGMWRAGVVRAVSGVDGSTIWERGGDSLGAAVALADADGDGRGEMLLQSGFDPERDASVELSFDDGVVIYTWLEGPLDQRLGDEVAVLGDVDGDGRTDYAIAAPMGDVGTTWGAGVVHVFRGSDLWFNAIPKVLAGGDLLTTTIREGIPGNAALRFIVAVSGTPFFVALPPQVTLDVDGAATFGETIPIGLAGTTVTMRAYAVDVRGKLIRSEDETFEIRW